MKKVLIDARFTGPDGIGRYTKETLSSMCRQPQCDLTLLVREQFLGDHNNLNYLVSTSPSYSLNELYDMDSASKKTKPQIAHFFDYRVPVVKYEDKRVVTIHDIFRFTDSSLCYSDADFLKRVGKDSFEKIQHLTDCYPIADNCKNEIQYSGLHHQYYTRVLSHALRSSDHVVVPSNTVKNDIINNFIIKDKISVIYHGLDHVHKKRSTREQRNADAPYFLYVGQNRPHKNCDFIISTFLKFKELHPKHSKINLILAGQDFQLLNSPHQDVLFSGYKNDKDLTELIENALALIHVPRHEGFGFTPAEALYCGTPVIASNIAVLREILGNSASFVTLNNQVELLNEMHKATEAQQVKIDFHLKDRTWDQVAENLYQLYNQL